MAPLNFNESYEYSPRHVEQFFPSIDRLRINLARLRQRVTRYPSLRHIDDLDNVDRCLEHLKSAMIAGEDLFFDQINRGRKYEQFSRENIEEFHQTIFTADEEHSAIKMPEQTSRFYSFRSVTETFVSIDELKSQLIRLRAVNPGTFRTSSSRIESFQAIERFLDHFKAFLRAMENLFLERFRIDSSNGNSLDGIISLIHHFRSECMRHHRDRNRLIRTIAAMDQTQIDIMAIIDTYRRVFATVCNSFHVYLGLLERAFPQIPFSQF
ncbi:hypothetical protein SSS_02027 [Sarcoptes scabiei]|uniref:Uncharacterized protein n=1 Tax=Sarcoptes scabiei TaxID=52283 RepID=A0A834REF4_SARSC|nr:hypothetical protein SSS_02027 [Sarcoptes scabiei]